MAADNVKDLSLALKAIDQGYAIFYKSAAENLMKNHDWLVSLQNKSQLEIIKDFQTQMKIYDDTIVDIQKCRDQIKSLASKFDSNSKVDPATISEELAAFELYKKILVTADTVKVDISPSLVSLSTQMCNRNVEIANFYHLPPPVCNFVK